MLNPHLIHLSKDRLSRWAAQEETKEVLRWVAQLHKDRQDLLLSGNRVNVGTMTASKRSVAAGTDSPRTVPTAYQDASAPLRRCRCSRM